MPRSPPTIVAVVLGGFLDPRASGLVDAAGDVQFDSAYAEMRAASPWLARFGLTLAIWLAYLAPLWLCGELRTLGRLPPPDRAALLARLLDHPRYAVRELALLLKLVASMALFRSDHVRERSGYDPAPEAVDVPTESGARPRGTNVVVLELARRRRAASEGKP